MQAVHLRLDLLIRDGLEQVFGLAQQLLCLIQRSWFRLPRLPVPLCRPDSADSELKELLAGPIEDETTVQQVLVQLRTHRALDESREKLHQIAKQARLALGPLPVNDATGALMSLCDAVIDRSV